ncbi:MAG: LamG-like jellyroll fold domain-containing protein, partial [Planctomycetota bacterium]
MCRKLFYLISFVLVLGLALTSPADAELVGWWRFDEGTGTIASDSSPNGNDGTIEGGAQWVAGQLGGALQFNGSNARVVAPNIPLDSRSFTITMWVNPVLYTGEQVVFSTGLTGSNDTDMHLRLGGPGSGNVPDGGVRMGFYGNDLDTVGGLIEDNNWYHITFWYDFDAQDRRIYIDGVQQAQGSANPYLGTSGDTIIGAWGTGQWFQGIIDDVQVYDHALTDNEIQAAMHGLKGNPYAGSPSPEDEELLTEFMMGILGTTLTWKKGDFAESHNVYFGDDFNAVNDGTGDTFQGNQTQTYFLVGYGYTQEDPLPGGFVPGTTYYWRIDEVNDTDPNSPWKGKIWSFSLPPTKAYFPNPSDPSAFIDPNVDLSWGPGLGGLMQTLYIDEDYDAVNNGTIDGISVTGTTTYYPGPLEYVTTYYWRVETSGAYGQIKGDVWSFKTAKEGGGIRGDYYNGMNFETYRLTRIDPQINFTWADGASPDPLIDADQFSVRWTGQIEAGFTETYTFYTRSDDGVRLWVDGQQLVNNWTDHAPVENSETIDFVAGEVYDIQMEMYENGVGAVAELRWSSQHTPKQIIPQAALSPPFKASSPNPPNGATGTKMTPTLTWGAGDSAASHEVYFGTDEDAVRNATTTSLEYIGPRALGNESYEPGKLEWESTYYWRIDEVNNLHPDSPWKGNIWSFTTGDFLVVDNFEDYNVTDKQIWAIWHDGLGYWDLQGVFHPGNGTGSGVGDEDNDNSYMEETIVNSGNMSMPYFYNNNDPAKMKYSEAKMTLIYPRDWTEEGVKALSLWFQGYPTSAGSFTDNLDGSYTMTVSGADITGQSDEFHYAYKSLTGLGSIIARVDSVDNTDAWAKAGVMIRETLDPNSAHAMVFVTPGNGVVFEYRPSAGADNMGSAAVQAGITAPQWVMLERISGGIYRASYSSDGSTWELLSELVSGETSIGTNALIGLSLSGNNSNATCQAVFSNVTSTGTGPWMNQDIGIQSNDPERMYVAIANSNGTTGMVYYEDNDNIDTDATQIGTWTEFNIDLKDFQDQGVNLADVNSIAIGIGTRGNTTPGGAGKMYFDDIRLYRPRYIPGKGTPLEADINSDGLVDYRDFETMADDWPEEDYIINPTINPTTANLVAYYALNEGSGTIVGDSAGANNGTVVG